MKLLLCTDCRDVFKLVRYGERSCLCGKVKGKLTGEGTATVNGKGISLTLGNTSLAEASKKMAHMDQSQSEEYYATNAAVQLYICTHSGYGNPQSRVIDDYPDVPEAETLSADKIAYRNSQST